MDDIEYYTTVSQKSFHKVGKISRHPEASFLAFTALIFQVEVLWVVTPCTLVVGYQRFRGP